MCLLFSLFWRIDAVTALVLLVVSSELIYFLWPFSVPFLPSCDRCDSKKYIITGVYARAAHAQGWERVDSSVFVHAHTLRTLIAPMNVSLFRFPWGCPSAFPWFVLPFSFGSSFRLHFPIYSCAIVLVRFAEKFADFNRCLRCRLQGLIGISRLRDFFSSLFPDFFTLSGFIKVYTYRGVNRSPLSPSMASEIHNLTVPFPLFLFYLIVPFSRGKPFFLM